MNKILSFIKLDMRLIKPYMKSVLILFCAGIFMGVMFKSGETLSSYFMVMLILIMSYPFAVIEKNNLNVLYGTLSMDRKTVVIGRYLFAFLFAAVGAVLAFFCSWILTAAFRQEFDIGVNIFTVCLTFALFSLVVGLQYPIYFKLGYCKAKAAALVPLFIVFGIFLMIPTLSNLLNWDISLSGMFESIIKYPTAMSIVFFFGGLLLLGISCFVSFKLYQKKDI